MNKILTIGRNSQCNICINDDTNVASRMHATLEIGTNGKYFIIDQSRNGTYVNGVKITPHQKVPVKRGDVISFAHVKQLDWNSVPKNPDMLLWASIAAAILILLAIVAVLLIRHSKTVDEDSYLYLYSNTNTDTAASTDPVIFPNNSQADEGDNDNGNDKNTPKKDKAPAKKPNKPVDAIY